ncbi:DUF1800 domain-containing protein [Panacibacter ginsenosidivorans]|uniref:DUF1800 domain-containing protein n=1 Tax=Panacibacter ginsenosidivorans TaxID=1813871 RepID=A0A5B8VAF9_9BACT|nr:DUF1800 domain-containing protein [Panacibacter ginsenosidivorans]QEC68457.1 DUF1800 domain-containing protein [Panacibacter ginsenosidivorans]
MSLQQFERNKHLLWRAGFGPAAEQISLLNSTNEEKVYQQLERSSENADILKVAGAGNIADLMDGKENGDMSMQQKLSDAERREIRRKSTENIKKLNLLWIDTMVNSEAQLVEKMSLFWHGHFACRLSNYYYQQALINVIRKNALGNFGDLLKSVSTSAAMLQFLNNQQNKKQHPNENFAREVMELFTMGRGHYTESDVKEAARAFTGWGSNLRGEFVFRKIFHDDESKTILGRTGNFSGDDVLNILLEEKQTAFFITNKLYKYFVNNNVDEERVSALANDFYESNYDIKALMRNIFTSDWFYDEKNIGAVIKSPVALLVGLRRALPMDMQLAEMQLLIQRSLGQVLFYPPNVAGWPGGENWIDSSTLMTRLRIPQMMQYDNVNISAKTDDDIQMGMQNEKITRLKKVKDDTTGFADIHWEKFTKQFKKISDKELYNTVHKVILQTANNKIDIGYAGVGSGKQSRDEYIQSIALALMCTPEYQMC